MTASHANTPFKSPISLVPRARVACGRRRPGRVAAPGGFPAPAERSDIRAHAVLGKSSRPEGPGRSALSSLTRSLARGAGLRPASFASAAL